MADRRVDTGTRSLEAHPGPGISPVRNLRVHRHPDAGLQGRPGWRSEWLPAAAPELGAGSWRDQLAPELQGGARISRARRRQQFLEILAAAQRVEIRLVV